MVKIFKDEIGIEYVAIPRFEMKLFLEATDELLNETRNDVALALKPNTDICVKNNALREAEKNIQEFINGFENLGRVC